MIPYADVSLLRCRELRYAWPASDRVLAIEDFQVAPGERMFLCGPSGSGKSTLLGLVTGVLTPDHGVVSLLDTPFSTLTATARDRFRADHVGYIFQQFNLLPFLDPLANVVLGCAWSKTRAAKAGGTRYAIRQEAMRLLEALELDAATLSRMRTGELSVGQQQRVAAARALIGGPALLVADEPTSALDAHSRDTFLQLLLAECTRHGAGVVFVSHDMTLARHFDRTVSLA